MRFYVVLSPLLYIVVSAQRDRPQRDPGVDTWKNCEELVELGKCYSTHREEIWAMCKKSCTESFSKDRKTDGEPEYFPISSNDESFFDLTALTSMNEKLDFNILRGVFTIVINFSVICQPKGSQREVQGEKFFKNVEYLHQIWPEGLEFLIFQYKHPKFNYEEDNCTSYIEASQVPGRDIRVMEVAELHGPVENQHPVYQYLQNRTGNHRMNYEQPAYFIVSPDGTEITVHRHTNFKKMRVYIQEVLQLDNEL